MSQIEGEKIWQKNYNVGAMKSKRKMRKKLEKNRNQGFDKEAILEERYKIEVLENNHQKERNKIRNRIQKESL